MDAMTKKPGLAAAILAGAAKPDPTTGSDMADDGGDDAQGNELDEGQMSAAEEAMSALKSGDTKAFGEALKAFVSMCGGY